MSQAFEGGGTGQGAEDPECVRRVPMHRWRDGRRSPGEDIVVEEVPFTIRVNGRTITRLMCSPVDLECLGLGFLRVEGYVGAMADVRCLGLEGRVFSATLDPDAAPRRRNPTRLTGCGGGVTFRAGRRTAPLFDRRIDLLHSFPAEAILERNRAFLGMDTLHAETGGIHSAALATPEALLRVASDVGRHNAVQKLAGWALLHRPDLHDAFLLSTGRISSEMVEYASRMGVSLIASRAASTLLAIREAEDAGISLLGFVRGGRMNIYTHPERVQ